MSQDDNGDDDALPCPIPSQAGDFASLMEDVIKLQNDQPWLVSDDARVPTEADGDVVATTGNMKNTGRDLDLSKKIRSARDRMWSSNQFKGIRTQRENIPAFSMKDEIASPIRNHQVVVISGATRSGKTTQVPQFVLDELISTNHGANANILLTQPRLISAIGVAEQVSAERCEKCGQTVLG